MLKYKVGDEVVLGDLHPPLSSKFNKGDKVIVTQKCHEGLDAEHYTVKNSAGAKWWVKECEIVGLANVFQAMKFRVKNAKHSKMIQKTLFALGYKWCSGQTEVLYTASACLYTNIDGSISKSNSDVSFADDPRPYMDVTPHTTYNLVAVVIKTAKAPETVELNGKVYLKADLEAAIQKLKPIE